MGMHNGRLLYVPVETKAREFLGKTFLAAKAAERGWTVILGEANQVRDFMRDQPGGAYIEIGIPEKKARRLEELRASGYRIANMCEEGLVYSDGREYCARKLGRRALHYTDRLLVVGSRNADDIRTNLPEFAGKLAVTGNPRFDTLLSGPRCVYRRDADALKAEFGRFVIVNTNFTRANPYGGVDPSLASDRIAAAKRRGMIVTEQHLQFFYRFYAYQKRLMASLQEMLEKLMASGAVDRIVVRPHPVEDRNTWVEWAKKLKNVDVRWEGSAIEWMLAAEAVLHPGCTTAIEGLMLDRPVFSYVPEPHDEFFNPADDVSEIVTSADDFIERLLQIRGSDETQLRDRFAPQREKLAYLIANVETPYAADRILDELERLELPDPEAKKAEEPKLGFLANLRRSFRKWRKPDDEERKARRRQKFPALSKDEADWAVGQWVEGGLLARHVTIDRLTERILVFH
jgi:surface carbohydrate biosynthesis protein